MTEPRQHTAVFGLLARELIANGKGFRFCARGQSMWPTIQDGDILHVEPIRKSPRIADIVLFVKDGEFKAHRIVGRRGRYFVTRGDTGMEIDGIVRREEIVGRVVSKWNANIGEVSSLGHRDRLRFLALEIQKLARRKLHRPFITLLTSCLVLLALSSSGQFVRAQSIGGVALDNTSSMASKTGGGGCPAGAGTTFVCSLNHTTNNVIGSTGLLVVGISLNLNGNGGSVLQSVTYNGSALTARVTKINGNFQASIWYLQNPAIGTFPVVITLNKPASGSPIGIVAGATTVYEVDLSGTITAAEALGTGTIASLGISSANNNGIVDTLAAERGVASTLVDGSGQNPQWNLASGSSAQDVAGAASSQGGATSVTMQESWTSSATWAMVAVSIPALNPTAVKVNSFAASGSSAGVALAWKSGAEVHNLGYNIYRDVGGIRTKLNPSLIAGSALLMRDSQPQHGGKSYGWIDSSPVPGAMYWLEDIDLNGARTLHGPVSMESASVATTPLISPSIGSLTRPQLRAASIPLPPSSASRVLERTVRPKAISSSAQNIGFQSAAKPGIKILVDHEGWYRVTQPQLVAAGLRPNTNSNLLHLYAEGVEQPIRITGGGGTFGPQSAIEFYGTAIDTPYSGQRVYWLNEQGRPGLRIADASPGGTASTQPPSFTQTLELKPKTTYFAALLRENTDNFFGPLISPTPDVETINVADLAGGEAQLTVSLQGVTTAQQHDVTVMLNGATLGDVTFSDQQEGRAEFAVPAGVLLNGPNSLTLTAQQGTNDISLVDTITLSFAHTYTAESDLLKFTADAGQNIAISGFSQPPSRLVDITNPMRPVRVEFSSTMQNGTYTLRSGVPWTTAGAHTLLALSDPQMGTPIGLVPHSPSMLHAAQTGADFVIITAPQFNAQFQPLAALHKAEGTSATVININDIYDEFNFGEPSPFAVKAFLRTATTAWTAKPKYLVLGGDASVDPRNYLGFGSFDFVPTRIVPTSQLKTASDDWFSDFNNTGFATIATGRMAARTPSDAQLIVSKIIAYSTGAAGSWNSQALIVADTDDPDISFTQAAQSVQGLLPTDLSATDVFAGNLGTSTASQDLLSGINSGQLLVNYNGHGSIQVWGGGGLFDDTMAASLTNGNKLPFFVIMNCLNGFFHDVYTQSLAESLMLAPNGGAVAVWASSGLTNAGPQFQMNDRLMQTLFSQPAPALGDAVLAAKSGISDMDVRRTFIFFGDPVMRLRMPGSSGEMSGGPQLQTTISKNEKSQR